MVLYLKSLKNFKLPSLQFYLVSPSLSLLRSCVTNVYIVRGHLEGHFLLLLIKVLI